MFDFDNDLGYDLNGDPLWFCFVCGKRYDLDCAHCGGTGLKGGRPDAPSCNCCECGKVANEPKV